MIQISHRLLRRATYAYLMIPLLIFAGGYLRWQISIPVIACLLFAYWYACRTEPASHRNKYLKTSIWRLGFLGFIFLLWTHLGGFNGLFYQSADWPWRNAIFHDLVEKTWPVIYDEKGSALAYYIGFWLPAALAGKIAGALAQNMIIAWRIARMALWAWSSLGMMLIALLLMLHLKADTLGKQSVILLVLIFFSGMDILGAAYANTMERVLNPDTLHLEWWTIDGKQYSSITTCLYWVFNQSIVPWLAVLCFLMEDDARNYVFLGMTCFCCGPLPLIGLVICMFARFAGKLVSDICRKSSSSIKAAFSPSNILMLIAILPVLGSFYLSNIAVSNTPVEPLSFIDSIRAYFTRDFMVFFMLDAGIYLLLTWKEHRHEPLYYGIALSLLLIPYFHLGVSEDFCMRASIPGIFILMTYCLQHLINTPSIIRQKSPGRLRAALLIIALLIGACTPAVEIYRGIYHVVQAKTIRLAQDPFGSIGNLDIADNFTTDNYPETFFFKYLARKKI